MVQVWSSAWYSTLSSLFIKCQLPAEGLPLGLQAWAVSVSLGYSMVEPQSYGGALLMGEAYGGIVLSCRAEQPKVHPLLWRLVSLNGCLLTAVVGTPRLAFSFRSSLQFSALGLCVGRLWEVCICLQPLLL
jgi:hypothetical protein